MDKDQEIRALKSQLHDARQDMQVMRLCLDSRAANGPGPGLVPRPMSEAPKDAAVHLVAVVRWMDGGWTDGDGIKWGLSGTSGWLPLPTTKTK
jgi:hypothetical protein